MRFHEVRFLEEQYGRQVYGSSGSLGFQTIVRRVPGGADKTSSNWDNGLRRYQAEAVSIEQEEFEKIISFFMARKGKHIRFRLHDVSDYFGTNELIGIGDGTTYIFQLKKHYHLSSIQYPILAVDTGFDKIVCRTIDLLTLSDAGNYFKVTDSTGNDGFYKAASVGSASYSIAGVNQTTDTFTITGDFTAEFRVNQSITVTGSTGNDGTYKIRSIALNTGNTEIRVQSGIPHATADGDIEANTSIITTPILPHMTADGYVNLYPIRDIKKPVEGNWKSDPTKAGVHITVNGVAQTENTDYFVDYETGEVIFATAPLKGYRILASFEFDVPVRFDTDNIRWEAQQYQWFDFSIPIVEERL